MKIIHLISGGDVGGAKTHVLSLLQSLCRENQVLLTCFMEGDFSRDAEKLGIPVKIMPSRNLPRVCHELVKLIRQEQRLGLKAPALPGGGLRPHLRDADGAGLFAAAHL